MKQINILANTLDVPYYYAKEDGTTTGMALQLVETLSKWLHYKYKIKSSPVVNVTVVDAFVESGQNDMQINLAVPTVERNKKFLISTSIDYQGYGLILQVPPPIPRWKNIVYPFTWIVWLAVVLSMIFTSVTFHLLYHEHEKSIATNSLTVVQFLLSNPLASVPESWRIRCLLMPWWIGSWLIAMSYTSNLIAILTIPAPPSEIKTTLQLAESNFRLCMLDYGEFVPAALASSTHSVLKALGDKLDMVPMQESMSEMGEEQCAARVLAGTHAHLEGYPYVKALYVKLGLGDQIYEVKERVYPSYLSLVFHKHTPWKNKYDVETEKLLETGILKRWYNEHMAKYEKRKESSSPLYLTPLSLHHLQGSFLLHLGGVIIGLLALTAEVVISKA
ncbi:ionotropic receptor 21a-like [Macrobrachium nipponense]|uniref:ionotropic receptor 21a-like n=1 Tax=Macrobrachium nipponense TaxID=159736 RepID=UPI0030C7F77E